MIIHPICTILLFSEVSEMTRSPLITHVTGNMIGSLWLTGTVALLWLTGDVMLLWYPQLSLTSLPLQMVVFSGGVTTVTTQYTHNYEITCIPTCINHTYMYQSYLHIVQCNVLHNNI